MRSGRAFTLIELLVVIAIIGLLSSIVLVSLNAARMKARDARRISDLQQIRIALELFYDANGHYPNFGAAWAYSCNSTWGDFEAALEPYMPQVPVDPLNTPCGGGWNTGYYAYTYGYNIGAYPGKYDLVTQLEDKSHPQRCEVRGWRYHTGGGEGVWCTGTHGIPGGYAYSPYLYADH